MAKPAVTDRRGFRTDVQGLRAIAVGLVLLYHAGVPFFGGGYVGVDVFFVISGFLISTHLLESLERDGRIQFADFYARRIRRILPASLTVAILTAIAAILFYPPLALDRVLKDALATILYVPNVWLAIQNTDYLADHSASPYQHYWSLGVEEQFYLFWPLVLMVLMLTVRRRGALLMTTIGLVAAASLIAGILLTPLDQPSAFFLLPTRAWELLIGALVGAALLRRPPALPRWIDAVGGWIGLAAVLAAAVRYDDRTAFPGTAALLPTIGTALVIYFGARSAAAGPTRMLSIRLMQFIGLISYSLYLVHWPLLIVAQAAVGEQNPLRLVDKVGLGIVLAVPLAWLLFRVVETPLRAPRSLVARRPRVTLWGTLGVSIILAAGMLGGIHWAATRDIETGDAVASAPAFPKRPPHATTFVPRNMTPSLKDAAADVAPVYADGCHFDVKREDVQTCSYGTIGGSRRIAVFGDSHSAQWFPAIEAYAKTNSDVQVNAYTKSSCPAVAVTVLDKDVPYLSCDRWREAVLQALAADPPDLVVISSFAGYAVRNAADDDARTAAWTAGVEHVVQRLRNAGIAVLVIADTPVFPSAPATCVSANVHDVRVCAGVRSTVLNASFAAAERAAAERAGARYVDFTDYICDDKTCPTVIEDHLVYRDVNHLTATFVRYLAPALAGPLDDLLGVEDIPVP